MTDNFVIFQTDGGTQYLYDAPTGSVHLWNAPLDEDLARTIYHATDNEMENSGYFNSRITKQCLFYIKLWRARSRAFRNVNLSPRLHFEKYSDVPLHYRDHIRAADLILVPTNDCNLRCAYCLYSTPTSGYRSHGRSYMPWEVAKKAIDLFFLYNDPPIFKSYSDRNLNIVFYGGEPLLNFELVKRSVCYAQEVKRDHYGLVLSIITNLTLFKDEYLPFLREHGISLMVSLDGPPQEQDRYRRFANGSPTSRIVLDNLRKIRELDEEYYFKNVHLQMTINGNSDLLAIYEYFQDKKDEMPTFQSVNFIKNFPFVNFHQVYPYDQNHFRRGIEMLLDIYKQQKLQGKRFARGDFFYHFLEQGLNDIYQRIQGLGGRYDWFTGACYIGRKLAVLPDGKIHICERINEHFPIGDVDRGLDEKQIISIINKYFECLPNCHQCCARSFCSICYATVCEHDNFTGFEKHCQAAREGLKKNLSFMFSILEERPDAFGSKDRIISSYFPLEQVLLK